MKKIFAVVISIAIASLLGGCVTKKAIRVECVFLINPINIKAYGLADKITWDNGTVTFKKRDCGVASRREYLTSDPEPIGEVIRNQFKVPEK